MLHKVWDEDSGEKYNETTMYEIKIKMKCITLSLTT